MIAGAQVRAREGPEDDTPLYVLCRRWMRNDPSINDGVPPCVGPMSAPRVGTVTSVDGAAIGTIAAGAIGLGLPPPALSGGEQRLSDSVINLDYP